MKIQTFSLGGVDIDVMFRKGTLAYLFKKDGVEYGNSVMIKDRKIESIVAATFLLLTNALESINKLNENTRLSKTA